MTNVGTRAPGPALGPAFRAAATDFYYQSIRLVPANVAWGAGFLGVIAIAAWVSPIFALVIAPLLGLPFVGIVRLASQIVRGEDVVLADFGSAMVTYALPALAAGIGMLVATLVFAANVASGIGVGGPIGWGFATLAAWGLAATWVVSVALWPLLVDPAREAIPVARRARLAGLLVLASPVRFAALAAALAVIALVSAVATPALLSVSVAFVALVAARFVLPAADRLEAGLPAGTTASST
jgi:hypothetical protein